MAKKLKDAPAQLYLISDEKVKRVRKIVPFKTQLLKWIGNKQRFAHEIISYFPESINTYYEPFIGSGAVLGTLSPEKGVASDSFKPLIEIFNAQNMLGFARNTGWALARAHARSGDPAVIAGYIGKGDVLADAIAEFAVAYADCNERDHAALVAAVRAGRLEAETEGE